jgi:hypothetical protein
MLFTSVIACASRHAAQHPLPGVWLNLAHEKPSASLLEGFILTNIRYHARQVVASSDGNATHSVYYGSLGWPGTSE